MPPRHLVLFSFLVDLCRHEDGFTQPTTARKPRFTPRPNTRSANTGWFSAVRDPKYIKSARRRAFHVSQVLDFMKRNPDLMETCDGARVEVRMDSLICLSSLVSARGSKTCYNVGRLLAALRQITLTPGPTRNGSLPRRDLRKAEAPFHPRVWLLMTFFPLGCDLLHACRVVQAGRRVVTGPNQNSLSGKQKQTLSDIYAVAGRTLPRWCESNSGSVPPGQSF